MKKTITFFLISNLFVGISLYADTPKKKEQQKTTERINQEVREVLRPLNATDYLEEWEIPNFPDLNEFFEEEHYNFDEYPWDNNDELIF